MTIEIVEVEGTAEAVGTARVKSGMMSRGVEAVVGLMIAVVMAIAVRGVVVGGVVLLEGKVLLPVGAGSPRGAPVTELQAEDCLDRPGQELKAVLTEWQGASTAPLGGTRPRAEVAAAASSQWLVARGPEGLAAASL